MTAFPSIPTGPVPTVPKSLFDGDAPGVARALIGMCLFVDGIGGRIVETEAYDPHDPASHSHKGRTPRNAAMFGPAGTAYVYRSYGLHWCLNAVCDPQSPGSAVLIRALEPLAGLDVMHARRGMTEARLLCAGPGRLCQALGVDRGLDGLPLDAPPFTLEADPSAAPEIVIGRRIGLRRAAETPWRFGLRGSPFLSRRFDR